MNNENASSRRKFLQLIGATSIASVASPLSSLAAKQKAEERILFYDKKVSFICKFNTNYSIPNYFLCRLIPWNWTIIKKYL